MRPAGTTMYRIAPISEGEDWIEGVNFIWLTPEEIIARQDEENRQARLDIYRKSADKFDKQFANVGTP